MLNEKYIAFYIWLVGIQWPNFVKKYSLVFKLLPILGMWTKTHSNMISIFSSCHAMHMPFLHISAKFLLNVSLGFHDMSILVTVRVSIRIESHTICSDNGSNTARVACKNIDIMLEWVFGHIPKIGNNFKTNEYFSTKFVHCMAKSHM